MRRIGAKASLVTALDAALALSIAELVRSISEPTRSSSGAARPVPPAGTGAGRGNAARIARVLAGRRWTVSA